MERPEDDAAGDAPVVRPAFEEWAPPEERLVAVVLDEVVTAEGRLLRPGDRVTPAQARALGVRWREVK